MEKNPVIAQKWFNIPFEQREKLFTEYNYSFPDILAKRTWKALGKKEREIIKHFLKHQPTPPPTNTGKPLHTQDEPRFYFQDVDRQDNLPDLQKWVDNDEMNALVDEEKGGIIGYVNRIHIDEIAGFLNERQALLDSHGELLDALERLTNDFMGKVSPETYKIIETAFNNAKKLKQ